MLTFELSVDICLEVGDRAVEIGKTHVRILHLAGERIAVDRVDGEVTARGRVEDGEGRSEAIANARCPSPNRAQVARTAAVRQIVFFILPILSNLLAEGMIAMSTGCTEIFLQPSHISRLIFAYAK